MSAPFLSITCTDCDFRGSSFATTGHFLWSHKGQTFQFERRLGLCLDCNKIVAIEDLPDTDTMERARSIHTTYTGQPLLRLLEVDYAKYLASQIGFEVLEEVLGLDRRPVCLECGQSAVRSIDRPDGVNSESPVSLNLSHPWCSGTLQVQSSGGLRMSVRAKTHVHSVHGQLISSYDE